MTLSTGGIPETLPSDFDGRDSIVELIEGQALLPRAATLEQVATLPCSPPRTTRRA